MSLDLTKYRSIPYKSKGRDFSGVDCLGLVALVYKHEKEILIPTYSAKYENANDVNLKSVLNQTNLMGWKKVNSAKLLTVCLWELRKRFHVGICVSEYGNKMLHITELMEFAVIEDIPSKIFNEHRFRGFWEYESI
jgi:cell wall-associated NlpC family hydrolase